MKDVHPHIVALMSHHCDFPRIAGENFLETNRLESLPEPVDADAEPEPEEWQQRNLQENALLSVTSQIVKQHFVDSTTLCWLISIQETNLNSFYSFFDTLRVSFEHADRHDIPDEVKSPDHPQCFYGFQLLMQISQMPI